jgi:hypothetical protein
MFPQFLSPLWRLEHLDLSQMACCLAPVLRERLPALTSLVAFDMPECGARPSRAVLRAALERMARGGGEGEGGGLAVYYARRAAEPLEWFDHEDDEGWAAMAEEGGGGGGAGDGDDEGQGQGQGQGGEHHHHDDDSDAEEGPSAWPDTHLPLHVHRLSRRELGLLISGGGGGGAARRELLRESRERRLDAQLHALPGAGTEDDEDEEGE